MIQIAKPKFPLGQIVSTPGAIDALTQSGQTPFEFLSRHLAGDWGIVDDEDKQANPHIIFGTLHRYSPKC